MKTLEFISLKHIRRLVLVLFASLTLGCTTTKTVLERHNEIMKTQPGKTHYATAMYVPIARVNQVPSTYQAFLNSACGGQPKRYHYEYKEWLKNLTAFGVGGRNQDEVEAYVIKNCESQTDHICVVQLYNQQDRCAATANDAYFRWKKSTNNGSSKQRSNTHND